MKGFSSLMGENFLFKIENVTGCSQLIGFINIIDEIEETLVEFKAKSLENYCLFNISDLNMT